MTDFGVCDKICREFDRIKRNLFKKFQITKVNISVNSLLNLCRLTNTNKGGNMMNKGWYVYHFTTNKKGESVCEYWTGHGWGSHPMTFQTLAAAQRVANAIGGDVGEW